MNIFFIITFSINILVFFFNTKIHTFKYTEVFERKIQAHEMIKIHWETLAVEIFLFEYISNVVFLSHH